jgi:DNA-binding transcriptional LysR family regulator
MDLSALEIFKTVVDAGGINKAAARLHRVPSNVTTRVKLLEAQLGTALFDREGGRLALTAEGKLLVDYADQLLRLSAEAKAALHNGGPRGTLKIGSLESTAAARLPSYLGRYHALYPEVRVELVTGTSGALVNMLQAKEVDAAFVAEPFNDPGLSTQVVFREEIVLIAPKGERRVRSARDLRNATLIAFANGCSYRRRLEAWLAAASIHADRVMEFQSYHAIIACVAAGTGFAAVPRSVLSLTTASSEVRIVALPAEVARARTHLAWRPSYHSAAFEALKTLLPAASAASESLAQKRTGKPVF